MLPNFNPEAGSQLQPHESVIKKRNTVHDYAKQLFEQQKKLEQQLKNNFDAIQHPFQKLQVIPQCRIDQGICDSFFETMVSACTKFMYVLVPIQDKRTNRLRKWDLWGPLMLVLIYIVVLDVNDKSMYLMGSIVVISYFLCYTIVALGGNISYLQTVSIIGYCFFPIFMGLVSIRVMWLFQLKIRVANQMIIFGCTLWSIMSSYVFLGVNMPQDKKFLGTIPMGLYYLYMTFFLGFD